MSDVMKMRKRDERAQAIYDVMRDIDWVVGFTGLSAAAIERAVDAGEVPVPIDVAGTPMWIEADLVSWHKRRLQAKAG